MRVSLVVLVADGVFEFDDRAVVLGASLRVTQPGCGELAAGIDDLEEGRAATPVGFFRLPDGCLQWRDDVALPSVRTALRLLGKRVGFAHF